jgi:uncharacterized protein YdhG (YjbR/CyaY superfamily)
MQTPGSNPDEVINNAPEDRKEALNRLRKTIQDNLPAGFQECLYYGMISYVVPHSLYPAGYHCDPKLPLPFISFASQKNFIAFYHMGMYANPELLDWFVTEFPKVSNAKLDMGKSCIRFKKPDQIPFDLIGRLVTKMTPEDWIRLYESVFRKK